MLVVRYHIAASFTLMRTLTQTLTLILTLTLPREDTPCSNRLDLTAGVSPTSGA